MVLKGVEVHIYVLIQYCHNFLYMMHWWKIAYEMIIVSIEMLICYIGFYHNCATAWDARVSTRLRPYIKSKWDVLVWNIVPLDDIQYKSYWVLRKA